MCMSIEAKMIYGLDYSDVPEEMKADIDEMLDYGDLDYASPWYDAPRYEWVIGAEVNVNGMTPEQAKQTLDDTWEEIPQILKNCGAIWLNVSAHVS